MVSELSRKDLSKEFADLQEQIEACKNQYRSTIDDAQKVVLKRNLEKLDKQIAEIEKQLSGKDLSEDTNRRSLALKEKLPKIDFKEALKIVKNILNEFEEQHGAACFLLNDSLNMAGDLFTLELKDLLNSETTALKHYEIDVSVTSRFDEIGFLQGMAAHLGLEEINHQDHYSKIIEKIFSSLENGSIVFLELRKIDLLDNKEIFLSWLIDTFWTALIKKMPAACELKEIEQIRFILVVSNDDIEEECLELPCFCQEFDMCKALIIPLQEWKETEIKTWLTKHSGLPKDRIAAMAKSIYKSSRGGTPKLICDALKNKLS